MAIILINLKIIIIGYAFQSAYVLNGFQHFLKTQSEKFFAWHPVFPKGDMNLSLMLFWVVGFEVCLNNKRCWNPS